MAAKVAAVVVAAGRGYRAGGDMPKQYREIAGEPVIRPTLAAFLRHPQVDAVQPVIHPDDADAFRTATAGLDNLLPPVPGGATRQASVRAGLEALRAAAPELVLIHDAARPFLSGDLISRAIAAAKQHGAAVPAIAITDTVKKVDAAGYDQRNTGPQPAAHGADAASLRLRPDRRASMTVPPPPAARILLTTPRWPNGPAIASTSLPAKAPM